MDFIMRIFNTPMGDLAKVVIDILLLAVLIFTLMLFGSLLAELLTERKHFKVCDVVLIDELRNAPDQMEECIKNSRLLKRQKNVLLEIINHGTLSERMKDALAIRLLDQEKDYWLGRIRISDLIARMAPMLGLLGTLIPLGPGLMALGTSHGFDVLSESLLTAFNTTIVGLACALLAMIISYVRRKWYSNYLSVMETLVECVLEVANHETK